MKTKTIPMPDAEYISISKLFKYREIFPASDNVGALVLGGNDVRSTGIFHVKDETSGLLIRINESGRISTRPFSKNKAGLFTRLRKDCFSAYTDINRCALPYVSYLNGKGNRLTRLIFDSGEARDLYLRGLGAGNGMSLLNRAYGQIVGVGFTLLGEFSVNTSGVRSLLSSSSRGFGRIYSLLRDACLNPSRYDPKERKYSEGEGKIAVGLRYCYLLFIDTKLPQFTRIVGCLISFPLYFFIAWRDRKKSNIPFAWKPCRIFVMLIACQI